MIAAALRFHVAEEIEEPPAELIDPDVFESGTRYGIRRPLKAKKEEVTGILRALNGFLEEVGSDYSETSSSP